MTKFQRKLDARVPQRKIDDLCELYEKYRGRDIKGLVNEMRARGWRRFNSVALHRSESTNKPGWIRALRLDELLTPEDRDFLRQRRIRRGFEFWLRWISPEYKWTWKFQKHIYRRLRLLKRGEIKRLMVFLPPRHGKSELVTVRYAVWRLMMDPTMHIVIGSYNQKLANRFALKIRRVARDAGMRPVKGTLQKADEWETPQGGSVKAVGVGAGITGFGADLVIIDDPVKSRADAESPTNRDRLWDWYNDDICTRLEPGGAVVLIQTRWHEDDLAGRLIKRMGEGGEQWEVISLPALAESEDPLDRAAGAALCPERFDLAQLEAKKQQMGSYSFSALYQQHPTPAGNTLFRREWFSRVVDSAPTGLRWCRGYDLAVSTKTSADFTASFRVALDGTTGDLYIADGFRGRIEFPDQRRYIVDRIREERNTEHGIEQALHGQAFVQELWRETSVSANAFRGVRVTTDKLTRALTWANRAEAGKVVLVAGSWIEAFLDEITHFPHSAHDDQTDAVSLAVQMLESRKNEVWTF